MANLITQALEYTTQNHPDWFQKTLMQPVTIANDYVRVVPNVTKKVRLKTMVDTGTYSQEDDRDCSWEPTQRITLDAKEVEVKNWKINEEQCLEDLDAIYSEAVMGDIRNAGANKTELPTISGAEEQLEDAIMRTIQNGVANDIEKLIWGSGAVDGVTSGILVEASADPDVITVANTTVTSANVVAEIAKVYNAIPNRVIQLGYTNPQKAPVRIFVGIDIYRFLLQALGTVSGEYQVVMPNFAVKGDKIYYMNVEIALIPTFPANTMVAGSRDNLVFATDLLSDAEVKAQTGTTLKDENILYIKGKYRAKGSYIFSDELVIYVAVNPSQQNEE